MGIEYKLLEVGHSDSVSLSFVALHRRYNCYLFYPTFLTGHELGLCPAVS